MNKIKKNVKNLWGRKLINNEISLGHSWQDKKIVWINGITRLKILIISLESIELIINFRLKKLN